MSNIINVQLAYDWRLTSVYSAYYQRFEKVCIQVPISSSSSLLRGPGRHLGSVTSTAITLQSGKTAADIGTLSRDRDTLDIRSSYATHKLTMRIVR